VKLRSKTRIVQGENKLKAMKSLLIEIKVPIEGLKERTKVESHNS